MHLDHFRVLGQGTVEKLAPEAPVEVGQELELKLGELGLHDPSAGVGKVNGYDISVGGAAKLVGKKVRVRVTAVMDGIGYAERVGADAESELPITAEGEAERPTRARRRTKSQEDRCARRDDDAVEDASTRTRSRRGGEPGEAGAPQARAREEGSRRGRGRGAGEDAEDGAGEGASRSRARSRVEAEADGDGRRRAPSRRGRGRRRRGRRRGEAPPKKRTRRGTRGGRNRRRKPAGGRRGHERRRARPRRAADAEREPRPTEPPTAEAVAEPVERGAAPRSCRRP